MIGSRLRLKDQVSLVSLAFVLSTVTLFPLTSARAGSFTVNNTSSESVNFAIWNTIPGTDGPPSWNPSITNMLMSVGGTPPALPYPVLSTVNTQGNTYGLPPGTGAFTHRVSSNPILLPGTTFGSSAVAATVSSSLNIYHGNNVNNAAGTSFSGSTGGTFLGAGDQMAASTAAVSYAHVHGDFTYTGVSGQIANVGAVLSANGFVNTTGGFVELADVGTITVSGIAHPFSMIVAGAYDHFGDFSQFSSGPVTINAPGDGTFTVSGSDAMGAVSLTHGAEVTIDSYLTMIADPGSMIELNSNDLAGGASITVIVAGAGGPLGVAVPEPPAAVELGAGLVLAIGSVAWFRRRRSRRAFTAPVQIRGRLAISLIFLAGVLIPGLASASSVTINNVGPSPSAEVNAFHSYGLNIDNLQDTVNFDGDYLSAQGLQPGLSVIYTVAFTEANGQTISDLTQLKISGMSNPTAKQNTEVQVLFEGIVPGPINPGPGIYFIPEPAGYFDVAAYLGSHGAPDVPGDLSVLVATLTSVPEPASLVTGGIALLLAALWVVSQRPRQA